MSYDLHTHSTASDGALSPAALMQLAAANGVTTLAITDHDTVAAYDDAADCRPPGLNLVPGIELSTTWAGRGIHIVGLNVDPANHVLTAGIAKQQAARIERARCIGQRLARLGIADPYPAVAKRAATAGIGRPHFAQYLVEIGFVKDERTAFRKYLGSGKTGDVRDGWATLPAVIDWIRAAGGIAVLAHPAKYKLSQTRLRLLLDDFVAAGGRAIEVVCGQQDAGLTRKMATLARDFGLAASVGSDFHDPARAWSRPGGSSKLPDGLEQVWELW